jgi:hypothetical protein
MEEQIIAVLYEADAGAKSDLCASAWHVRGHFLQLES